MATSQNDGDGNDPEDSQDNVLDGSAPLMVKGSKPVDSYKRTRDRSAALQKADLEAKQIDTEARKTELASKYPKMGSSYHRNGDGTYTQNTSLSPDDQGSAMASSVKPSRIDSFKKSQEELTPNEKLNGGRVGASSWDSNSPQNNPTIQAKMKDAVAGVINSKLEAGVDPSTNVLTGARPQNITNAAVGSLDTTAANERARSNSKTNSIISMANGGNMTGALNAQPAQQAASKTASKYATLADKVANGNVLMTPHGVVSGTQENLGAGGFARLMASPSVQGAAKDQGTPQAMAAVTPTPSGAPSDTTAVASSSPPRQVKQAAYTPPPSPIMGGVLPKPKGRKEDASNPTVVA